MVLEDGKDSVSTLQITGHEIISGSIDGGIRIYDIRKGTLTVDRVPSPVTSVRVSADGNCLLTSTLDNALRLVDKETGELLNCYTAASLKNSRYKIESTFSNTDSHVVSGSETGEVLIWELVEATLVKTLKGHSRSVLSVCYHPVAEQQYLLSASSDGTVILWGA
jgi:mitogen-activated protein kinase organizer 1